MKDRAASVRLLLGCSLQEARVSKHGVQLRLVSMDGSTQIVEADHVVAAPEKTDLTFAKLRQPRFYVAQPMRMATVEALVDLGFVHTGSQRFNSFRCTDSGRDLVEAATNEYRPYNTTVEDYLVRLATEPAPITVTRPLQLALSPIEPLAPVACDLIRSRLCEGTGKNRDAARRKNGLAWVSSIDPGKPTSWETRPPTIDTDHWSDLRLGALFFLVRDAAIDVLNEIETAIGRTDARTIASTAAAEIPAVQKQLRELHGAAQRFLDEHADPTDASRESQNWPRRSATPRPDARLSGASSSTVVSKSISRVAMAVAGRGQPSPHFCRRQK